MGAPAVNVRPPAGAEIATSGSVSTAGAGLTTTVMAADPARPA